MCICIVGVATVCMHSTSLEPGSFNLCGRKKEPGTHCLRMLQIAPEFRRDRKLSCTFVLCDTYKYVITERGQSS